MTNSALSRTCCSRTATPTVEPLAEESVLGTYVGSAGLVHVERAINLVALDRQPNRALSVQLVAGIETGSRTARAVPRGARPPAVLNR